MRRLATRLFAALLALTFVSTSAPAVTLRNIVLKANRNDYPQVGGWGYSACWGYVHPDGREYAILGTTNGTAIYNVTNPDNVTFVKFIPGLSSSWREMKAYRTWLYIVTENATAAGGIQAGMQIVRMTDPDNPVVLTSPYATNFNRSHTVAIDTARAILICNGTNYFNGSTTVRTGMRILSLANPEAPVEIASWPSAGLQPNISYYVHDCYPKGNRLYASSIYSGIERIFDFTNAAAPVEIKNWTYSNAYYTHSSWVDATNDYMYICDEGSSQAMRVFDISTETAPVFAGDWTSNPTAIVHNPRVKGDTLWLANYTEGIRALDISDPAHPAEWGYADSYPGASGGYNGVWECYPFFPSGTIIASDMNTGLYVYRTDPNYGVVRAEVKTGGLAVTGATVTIQAPGDSAVTTADGIASFAPDPGSYTLTARKFGYVDAVANVNVSRGDKQSVVLTLVPKATTSFTGTVLDDATSLPLEGAEVNLKWTPVHEHTAANGAFDLGAVPVDVYRVDVRRPGYVPVSFDRQVGPGAQQQTFRLKAAAVYDPLTTGTGWSVGGAGTGDDALNGIWTRVEPLGTSTDGPHSDPLRWDLGSGTLSDGGRPLPGPLHEGHEGEGAYQGQVQPETDRSPGTDSLCFVTGQGTSATNIAEADVDGGHTSLTSPAYNVTGMVEPTIGYWHWFYSQFGQPEDWMAVLISNNNGASWVPVDTLRGLHNHWEEDAIAVADHVTPTTQVRVRFVVGDTGVESVVEGAVDDLVVYDAATPSVGTPPGGGHARLAFRAPSPNPSAGGVALALAVPRDGVVDADVLDLTGRRVATLHHGPASAGTLRLSWNGADAAGHAAPPGLYFASARTGGESTRVKIARVR